MKTLLSTIALLIVVPLESFAGGKGLGSSNRTRTVYKDRVVYVHCGECPAHHSVNTPERVDGTSKDTIAVDNVLRVFFAEGSRDSIVGTYSVMHEKADERGNEILISRLDRLIPNGTIASVKIVRIDRGVPMKVEFVRTVPNEYWATIYIHGPGDISGTSSR